MRTLRPYMCEKWCDSLLTKLNVLGVEALLSFRRIDQRAKAPRDESCKNQPDAGVPP
jgi:hypothetical protein